MVFICADFYARPIPSRISSVSLQLVPPPTTLKGTCRPPKACNLVHLATVSQTFFLDFSLLPQESPHPKYPRRPSRQLHPTTPVVFSLLVISPAPAGRGHSQLRAYEALAFCYGFFFFFVPRVPNFSPFTQVGSESFFPLVFIYFSTCKSGACWR